MCVEKCHHEQRVEWLYPTVSRPTQSSTGLRSDLCWCNLCNRCLATIDDSTAQCQRLWSSWPHQCLLFANKSSLSVHAEWLTFANQACVGNEVYCQIRTSRIQQISSSRSGLTFSAELVERNESILKSMRKKKVTVNVRRVPWEQRVENSEGRWHSQYSGRAR